LQNLQNLLKVSQSILDRKASKIFAIRITSLKLSIMNSRPSEGFSESSLVLSDHPQCRHSASDHLVLRAALYGWPPVCSVALKQIASCRLESPSVRLMTTCRLSRRLRGEPRRITSAPRRIASGSWGISSDSPGWETGRCEVPQGLRDPTDREVFAHEGLGRGARICGCRIRCDRPVGS
jgi:hypothetical protein